MNNWAFLFLGLAIGWLIGMLVDWYFWRNRRICRDVEDKLRFSLQEVEGKNLSLQSQLSDYSVRGQKIGDLELALEQRGQELTLLRGDVDKRNKELQKLSAEMNAKESRFLNLEKELKQRDVKTAFVPTGDFKAKESELVQREQRLTKLETDLKARENSFGDWEGRLKKRDAELIALAASLTGREKELSTVRLSAEPQAETGKLEARIRELQQQLHSAESDRDRFERKVTDAEGFQRKLTQQVADCNRERTDLNARLEDTETQRKKLDAQLAAERDLVAQKLRDAEQAQQSLQRQLRDLEARATSSRALPTVEMPRVEVTPSAGISLEKGDTLSVPEFKLPQIELPDLNPPALSLGAAGLVVGGLSGMKSESAEPSFRPRQIDIEMPDVESELPKIDLPDVSVDVDDDLPTVDLPDVAITTGVAAMGGQPTESAEFLRLARSKAPTIDEIAAGVPTGPATITGTGVPGTRIELLLERTSKGIATVGPDGRWSLTTFISEKGRFKLQARTIDSRNNLLSQSEKVRLRVFAPIITPSNDDLKRVWGIGPAIEKLLQRNGINSFAKLGETPVENVELILREAGERFNLANYETWREQAQLAAVGKWQELKLLQEKLSAEREQKAEENQAEQADKDKEA